MAFENKLSALVDDWPFEFAIRDIILVSKGLEASYKLDEKFKFLLVLFFILFAFYKVYARSMQGLCKVYARTIQAECSLSADNNSNNSSGGKIGVILKTMNISLRNINRYISEEALTMGEGGNDTVLGPVRSMNFSPNKPKLSSITIDTMKSRCVVAISDVHVSEMPEKLNRKLTQNLNDQQALKSLQKLPNLLPILRTLLDDSTTYETFPTEIWKHQAAAAAAVKWIPQEKELYSVLGMVLTDFWGLLKRLAFNRLHERTFWVEYVVPLFKHFTNLHSDITFSWLTTIITKY